jgi:hypothetical protein
MLVDGPGVIARADHEHGMGLCQDPLVPFRDQPISTGLDQQGVKPAVEHQCGGEVVQRVAACVFCVLHQRLPDLTQQPRADPAACEAAADGVQLDQGPCLVELADVLLGEAPDSGSPPDR